MKTAYQKNIEIQEWIAKRLDVDMSLEDVNTLRRAEMTLHRWAEQECGDGNEYGSWAIERDEITDKPYRCVYPHDGKNRRYPIPDREKGALKRIRKVCKQYGIYFYHQTDPRGCALYIHNEPLTDTYYNRGMSVAA